MFDFLNNSVLRNEIADLKYAHERALTRMAFANDLEKTQQSRELGILIAERDARILQLERMVTMLEDEMEKRLDIQEDIYLDQIVALKMTKK
jgi:hypothetical protein